MWIPWPVRTIDNNGYVLQLVGALRGRFQQTQTDSAISRAMGACTPGKLQRILASAFFSQHAKLNMAGFVLYLLVRLA